MHDSDYIHIAYFIIRYICNLFIYLITKINISQMSAKIKSSKKKSLA